MAKQRVLLICSQYLFGTGVEMILRAADDLELIGPWGFNEDVCRQIAEIHPSVIVVAYEDPQNKNITRLTSRIIEQYPELSIIRAGLTEDVVRVFSIHLVPARGADLLDTIRSMPVVIAEMDDSSNERSDNNDSKQ